MRKSGYFIMGALIAGLLFQPAGFSVPKYKMNSCPAKPYPVSNAFSRGLQHVLGLNLIVSNKFESEIKKQLLKVASGDIQIDITPYSAMDLLAGKAKSVKFNAKNVAIDDVHISSVEAKTFCDFIYLDYNKDPIVPLAPLFLGFKGTITESDLNKTVSSKRYQDELSKLKVNLFNTDFDLVELQNLKVEINNNKIYFNTNVHFAGMPSFMNIPMKIGAGLKVVSNKIKLSDIQVISGNVGGGTGSMGKLIEMMSPALFDLNSLVNNGANVEIKNVSIKDDKIDVDGTVWLPAKS